LSPAAPAGLMHPGGWGPRLESIRFEPPPQPAFKSIRFERRPPPPYHADPTETSVGPSFVTQLHGGFFDAEYLSSGPGVLAGVRSGAALGDHAQIGIHSDWSFKTSEQTVLVAGQTLPNGNSAQLTRVLARSYSHLV